MVVSDQCKMIGIATLDIMPVSQLSCVLRVKTCTRQVDWSVGLNLQKYILTDRDDIPGGQNFLSMGMSLWPKLDSPSGWLTRTRWWLTWIPGASSSHLRPTNLKIDSILPYTPLSGLTVCGLLIFHLHVQPAPLGLQYVDDIHSNFQHCLMVGFLCEQWYYVYQCIRCWESCTNRQKLVSYSIMSQMSFNLWESRLMLLVVTNKSCWPIVSGGTVYQSVLTWLMRVQYRCHKRSPAISPSKWRPSLQWTWSS